MAKKEEGLDKELKTLLRRVALIQGVKAGKLELRLITVTRKKSSWVVRAKVKSYVRRIAPAGWKP